MLREPAPAAAAPATALMSFHPHVTFPKARDDGDKDVVACISAAPTGVGKLSSHR
jgi:hypothetical protein